MTLPVWPSGINTAPLLAAAAVNEFHQQPVLTDMQYGPTRMRSSSRARVVKLAHAMSLTKADYQTFRTWLIETIANGTSRFTMDVWNGSVAVERTCWIEGGAVSARVDGNRWLVQFTLCVVDL